MVDTYKYLQRFMEIGGSLFLWITTNKHECHAFCKKTINDSGSHPPSDDVSVMPASAYLPVNSPDNWFPEILLL